MSLMFNKNDWVSYPEDFGMSVYMYLSLLEEYVESKSQYISHVSTSLDSSDYDALHLIIRGNLPIYWNNEKKEQFKDIMLGVDYMLDDGLSELYKKLKINLYIPCSENDFFISRQSFKTIGFQAINIFTRIFFNTNYETDTESDEDIKTNVKTKKRIVDEDEELFKSIYKYITKQNEIKKPNL